MILEELELDYKPIYIDVATGDQKKEPHVKYNPNGRIPTLIDHQNGDFAIWCVSASPACLPLLTRSVVTCC